MSKISWKKGTIISIESREKIYFLAQMIEEPYLSSNPNWVPYYGNPHFFHCGFDGYLENRTPTPDNPM